MRSQGPSDVDVLPGPWLPSLGSGLRSAGVLPHGACSAALPPATHPHCSEDGQLSLPIHYNILKQPSIATLIGIDFPSMLSDA